MATLVMQHFSNTIPDQKESSADRKSLEHIPESRCKHRSCCKGIEPLRKQHEPIDTRQNHLQNQTHSNVYILIDYAQSLGSTYQIR